MIKEIYINDIKEMLEINRKDKLKNKHILADFKKRMTENKPTTISTLEILHNICVEDRYLPGLLIEYPHGKVIKQEKHSYYYRGEPSIFGSSKASLHRFAPIESLEKDIYYFITEMRIYEFSKLIDLFPFTKDWPSDILYKAIAQHYGIHTDMLDITNDFEVALFFATCKYDEDLDRYRPLNEEDLKDEKNKYGLIYRKNSFIADLQLLMPDLKKYIIPVGFQPFMRCHRQYAYAYIMDKDEDLYKDNYFDIMKFKQSTDLSKKIFNLMDGGNKIFPYEGLNKLKKEIEIIKNTKVFSTESFKHTLTNFKFDNKDIDIKQELLRRNIKINKSPLNIDLELIEEIDKEYKNYNFFKECPMPIHIRPIYYSDDK